jgi:hypothetical protein
VAVRVVCVAGAWLFVGFVWPVRGCSWGLCGWCVAGVSARSRPSCARRLTPTPYPYFPSFSVGCPTACPTCPPPHTHPAGSCPHSLARVLSRTPPPPPVLQTLVRYLSVFHVDDVVHKALIAVMVVAALLMPIHVRTTVFGRDVLGFAAAVAGAYFALGAAFVRAGCYIPPGAPGLPSQHRRWCLVEAGAAAVSCFAWVLTAIFSGDRQYQRWERAGAVASSVSSVVAMLVCLRGDFKVTPWGGGGGGRGRGASCTRSGGQRR